MERYRKRLIDSLLKKELEAFGAVLLTGPKWCGKTWTAREEAKSVLYMQDPDHQLQYQNMARLQPSRLLQGEHPRLIDEWQMAPQLWDAVRFDIDKQSKEGLYILTGSTTVDETQIAHSGAGRIARLRMRTMSLFESEDSTGEISLMELFKGKHVPQVSSSVSLEKMAEILVRGGWPNTLGKSTETARRQISGYCDVLTKSDIQTIDGVARNELKAKAILRSYARHISTQAKISTIVEDVANQFELLSRNTVADYLTAFTKLFVIEDLEAWSPSLRSKTSILSSPTRHFVDPAIAAHFLNASSADLLHDLRTFGLLFESLVIRDLRVYTEVYNGGLFHYRDRSGLEADAVIHLPDGRWAAIEVKLGEPWADEAADKLKALRDKIDADKMPKPSFLAVITASGYAYQRDDGVLVLPISCLRE